MNRFLLLAFLVLACTSACFAALDRGAFTFTNYDLELRVDPQGQALAARGKITLRNDSSQPQTVAAMQISSSLSWRLVQVAGKPVQFETQPYTTDIDHTGSVTEAIITLPAAAPPRGTVEIEVGYSGTISADATRLIRIGTPATVALGSDWDQISPSFTGVRGIGFVAWYPVEMEAASLSSGNALFEALGDWKAREAQSRLKVNFCWINDESPLTVVANGQLEGIGRTSPREEGQGITGCTPYRFAPLGLTVPTFAIGNFVALQQPLITVYHIPEHEAVAGDYVAAAEKLAPVVGQWLGPPRERVRVVELNSAQVAPFESGGVFFTPLNSEDAKPLQLQMVHQLTHVSLASDRPWIYEGVAHFLQAVEREQQDGRQAALDYMRGQLPPLVEAERAVDEAATGGQPPPAEAASQSLISATDDVFYHTKAMYVWWMLRDRLGDQALRRALQSYRAEQDKEPSYMQRLVQSQSKQNLEWFFDDWVYRDRGLPDFQVESAYPRKLLAGEYVLTVTVKNTGDARAEVPVTAKALQGEMSHRLLVPAKGTAVVRIRIPAAPTEAVVNDGSVPESDPNNNSLKITVAPGSP
ncbi:MAG TPA: hypothetical protein VJN48_10140 [Terriglobales bacterium]|nr:hypothetical protein [Terriglobales bacterium]